MLERLRLIDWSAYTHAYGAADDVPDLITALTSPNPKDWVAAIDSLHWTIYHQGAVYDSTAIAVPFLIELLHEPSVRCRGRIMELLAHIATGQSPLELTSFILGNEEEDAELHDEDEQLQLEEERRWAAASREAVWMGWPTYLELGADLDKRLRIASPYLLGQLATLDIESLPDPTDGARKPCCEIPMLLASRLENEPNDLVAVSLIFGLESWAHYCPQYENVLQEHVESANASPPARLAAAMCTCCLPSGPTPVAMDLMLESLARIEECSCWFESDEQCIEEKFNPSRAMLIDYSPCEQPEASRHLNADEDFVLPWLEDGLLQEILDRFTIMDAPAPARLNQLLIEHLRHANQYTLETYAEAIRRFVMYGDPLTCSMTAVQLSDDQRAVIAHLFHDASYWATNVGNVELAFDAMGVPYCRGTLGSWLGEPAEVTCPRKAAAMLEQVLRAEWLHCEPEAEVGEDTREQLDTLILAHVGSDAFMPLLHQFPNLQVLEIGPFTTDAGLQQLPTLPLTDLTLDVRIGDAGVKELLRFPRLRSLNTFGAKLTDAALETIGQLRHLESLYLSGHLTLAGLHALLPLQSLTELSLPRMDLSLAVIPILQQLPSLNTLSLHGQCFNEDERRRVKLELPACHIWFNHCDL
ncbi:MAG: hypothetical protein KDB14_17160 [Planctomycetales bacterium]|nr:hypothetical protein [Planctomycetales bacterium]